MKRMHVKASTNGSNKHLKRICPSQTITDTKLWLFCCSRNLIYFLSLILAYNHAFACMFDYLTFLFAFIRIHLYNVYLVCYTPDHSGVYYIRRGTIDFMAHDKKKLTVALLSGGYSPEGTVAVWSGQHVQRIFEGDEDYITYLIRINKSGWYYGDVENGEQRFDIDRRDFSLTLSNQEKIKFDLAVLLVGGCPGEDGQLQGYLQMSHVPYVGCGLLPSAVTFNKSIANRIVRSFNSSIVHVSPSIDVFHSSSIDTSTVLHALNTGHIRLPLIVKPTDSGSSLGVSKVTDVSQLDEAFKSAFKESNHILVEQFIDGREITVGVVRINGQIQVLPITEIIYHAKSIFYDNQTKVEGNSQTEVVTPADLKEDTRRRVEIGVSDLYEKLNLSGLVRIDLMLEYPDEKVFFLEVNSAPSQTGYSIIMQQLAKTQWGGVNLVKFYKQLFKEALN